MDIAALLSIYCLRFFSSKWLMPGKRKFKGKHCIQKLQIEFVQAGETLNSCIVVSKISPHFPPVFQVISAIKTPHKFLFLQNKKMNGGDG
jgi:hypothetical protein